MVRFGKDIVQFAAILTAIIGINILSNYYYFRVDLTSDGRFTLKEMTVRIFKEAEGTFELDVYLSGDLPGNYERMKTTLKEKLEDIRARVGRHKLKYHFIDPTKLPDSTKIKIAKMGVLPVQVNSFDESEASAKLIYPGAIMKFTPEGTNLKLPAPTMFLPRETWSAMEDVRYYQGMNELEYALAAPAIQLTTKVPKNITFIEGHGEPLDERINENIQYLTQFYNVQSLRLYNIPEIKRDSVDVLILLKPKAELTDADKYKIDHYMNQGGNVIFMLDVVETRLVDSLGAFMGLVKELNVKDLLFTYGLRLNYDLILDDECVKTTMVTGPEGYEQQVERSWRFDPILKTFGDHPIVENIEGLYTRELGTIDTVNSSGLQKTPLIYTSVNSRTKTHPIIYPFNEVELELKNSGMAMGNLPICYLLEGKFPQHYEGATGRPAPAGVEKLDYNKDPRPAKMIVFSDGDIIIPSGKDSKGNWYPVGYEKFARRIYDNKKFLKRAVDYLLDRHMIEDLRFKNLVYRPLNKNKIKEEKNYWRMLNLVVPVLLPVFFFFLIPFVYRKVRRQNDRA